MSSLPAISNVLGHSTLLAMPLVLAAGVIAGLNPCCIALYPAAAAIYCGASSPDACCGTNVTLRGLGLKRPIAFITGIAAATTTLGVIAGLAGQVIGQLGTGFRYAIAAVPLIMGLHLIGWLRLPIRTIPHRVTQSGWLLTFSAGFLLSLALTPCGTPVLASVLSYVTYKGNVVQGAILMFLYGIGSSIPVVMVGTTAAHLRAKFENAGYGKWAERFSGTALLALAFFLIWRA
jgi:cytochrome c biogenesis protein CcdA